MIARLSRNEARRRRAANSSVRADCCRIRSAPLTLCSSFASCGEDNIDVDLGTGKHAYQGIDDEKINPSANEIADPRLCDAEQLSGFSLGELAFLNELPHFDHERRAKPKVLSLIVAKAEIGEDIST
jgi:hypothetical protein